MEPTKKPVLFSISFKCLPQVNPTANRSGAMLTVLSQRWEVRVLTAVQDGAIPGCASVDYVPGWRPTWLLRGLERLKLSKLIDLFVWPDSDVFWIFPAIIRGYQLIRTYQPNAIAVFVMPYSAALVGIVLKWLTGRPLVINLGDSPTCTDMHHVFPTWLHYQMFRWLEDFYVQQSDAIIYVSQTTLDRVRDRQSPSQHHKFHLLRGGGDQTAFDDPLPPTPETADNFTIVYTGGMNGWYEFHTSEQPSVFKRLYRAWNRLGTYQTAPIDYSASSPIYLARAVRQVLEQYPDWQGKVHIHIYGNKFPRDVIDGVLQQQGVAHLVTVTDSLPNREAVRVARQADLLFLTLPDRPDGSAGGRISLKTYEYLMNDRPILAAIPNGENRVFLTGQPGVWITAPTDVSAMAGVLTELIQQKFSGTLGTYPRPEIRAQLNYIARTEEFEHILQGVCQNSTPAVTEAS